MQYRAFEREFFPVHGKEILSEEDAQMFEQIAESTDDRVVFANRLAVLSDVDDVQHDHGDERYQNRQR